MPIWRCDMDVRTLITSAGVWRKLAYSEVCGQAVAELHQYVDRRGQPTELYRTVYGLEQKDWGNRAKAEESYQSSVLHQWDCAGFNE